MNIFEQATRAKLRFTTPRGMASVEDLWDLDLTSRVGQANLNSIAVALHRQLKETKDAVSFIEPADTGVNAELQLKFDIVKRIIEVRVAERDLAKTAQERAELKQKLLGILARKEDAALESKSVDELRELANTL